MANPSPPAWASLVAAAREAVSRLERDSTRLVLAESCTAGLVAAALGTVPGVSHWFCGSLVTYRPAQKIAWLGVPEELLARFTAESPEAAEAMVRGALDRTPEAIVAASITGHLGPDAPPERDGQVFIVVGQRGEGTLIAATRPKSHQLVSTGREARQMEAAKLVLEAVTQM
jgi:nicotinamide-nucleotide amidase